LEREVGAWLSSTAEVRQALERAEIEMSTFGASKDFEYLLKNGKVTIVSQTGYVQAASGSDARCLAMRRSSPICARQNPGPDGSTGFRLLGRRQPGRNVGRPASGHLTSIVDTYVKAFDATINDPKFQDEYARIDPDSVVAKKPELEKLVSELPRCLLRL